MSDSIERTLEDELPLPVAPAKKKRVMSEKQKEMLKENLAKGRAKLKEINEQKKIDRGLMMEQKVAQKLAKQERIKTAEEKRIDLAMEALAMLRQPTAAPINDDDVLQEEQQPKQKPKKKFVPEYEDETEVEEIIVKKSKPKKKTIVYMDNDTETETEPEIKPKRSYKKATNKQTAEQPQQPQQQQKPQQTPYQNIVFY